MPEDVAGEQRVELKPLSHVTSKGPMLLQRSTHDIIFFSIEIIIKP